MLAPVCVVPLHTNVPVQPVAVKVAFSAPQTVGLLLEITGDTGFVNVSIVIVFDDTLSPQLVTHFAVYVPAVLT